MEQFVDWESGTAHFDTGIFAKYLEFADTFPLHSARERMRWGEIWEAQEMLTDGRQILYPTEFFSYQGFLIDRTIFGGEIVFKGFPTEKGNGSAFLINGGLTITTACKDKEGAWEYIRTFLTEEWQQSYRYIFPISKTVFERNLSAEVAVQSESWMSGPNSDSMIHNPNMTNKEAQQIRELINTTTYMISYDEALWNIVIEGASDFFNGQSTLENVIRIIQSRASIYVSEQSG